jgi:integrase
MTVHLTDLIVKKLELPAKGSKVHYDATTKGFGVSVTTAGARSFVLNYRTKAGRERRMTIGRFGNWSTVGARDKAKELRRLIDAGGDPLAGIEAERAAPTMADLIERFEAEHMPRLRPETQKNYRQMIKNHIAPRFGSRVKVADVSYADCDALHRSITKPFAANRTRSVLSKMFTLANRWGWRSDNPTKSVERNPEAKRKRYLSADELTRLTRSLAEHPNRQVANIVRMLLLTGARVGEVRSMRWADISDGVWTKPASTTKQKSDHVVPLSALAKQLLAEISVFLNAENYPLVNGENKSLASDPYVFPSSKGRTGHVAGFEKAWAAILKAAKIEGLRVHDLRHSYASLLASSGASLPLIGAMLGHSSPQTTHRYAHLFQDPQKAAAERVAAIVDGKSSAEVIDIKGGRRTT